MEKLRDINPAHERFGYLSLVVGGAVVLAIGLLVRSDLFLSVVGFVLEIIGWLGILSGAAIATGGVAAFGNERGWWDRLIEFSGQSEKIVSNDQGPVRLRPVPARPCIFLPALDVGQLLR